MDRRRFVLTTGVAVGSTTALAGCTSSPDDPPPRKSNVIESVSVEDQSLRVQLEPTREQWVMSRRNLSGAGSDQTSDNPTGESMVSTHDEDLSSGSTSVLSASGRAMRRLLGQLSPVGVVAAKGRGATGRTSSGGFRSAPKTTKGRAMLFGGAYVGPWYTDHQDEVSKYPVTATSLGAAYLGDDETFQESAPGPGPMSWDTSTQPVGDPSAAELTVPVAEPGWYRLSAKIEATDRVAGPTDDPQFGWESVDARVEQTPDNTVEVAERWKVSPRI